MNMRFMQPVSMKVDQKQFDYLEGELKKRGYNLKNYTSIREEYKYICTNLAGENDDFSDFTECLIKDHNRRYIDHYNPELFLALASMTNEKYGIAGEWWMFTGVSYNFTNGKLYQASKKVTNMEAFIDDDGDVNGFGGCNLLRFRKATKQELINHFTKGNMSSEDDNAQEAKPKPYQVKQSDLVERIAAFPIEVVRKMVERQVEQGNKSDVSVFQRSKISDKRQGGFLWRETVEGECFWRNIISHKDFNLFFLKYPKSATNEHPITHKVTRSQMAEIHSIACREWKKKIEKIVEKYLGVFANETELPNEEVKAMFNAATSAQKPVLEKVFPNYGKKVVEKDTLVMCGDIRGIWSLRYCSHENKCYDDGNKSTEASGTCSWKYIVPVSDFDFNNLESNVATSIV